MVTRCGRLGAWVWRCACRRRTIAVGGSCCSSYVKTEPANNRTTEPTEQELAGISGHWPPPHQQFSATTHSELNLNRPVSALSSCHPDILLGCESARWRPETVRRRPPSEGIQAKRLRAEVRKAKSWDRPAGQYGCGDVEAAGVYHQKVSCHELQSQAKVGLTISHMHSL